MMDHYQFTEILAKERTQRLAELDASHAEEAAAIDASRTGLRQGVASALMRLARFVDNDAPEPVVIRQSWRT